MAGRDPAAYLTYFFDRWTVNRHAFPPDVLAEYNHAFSTPGALRAGLDDYRAKDLDSTRDDADYGHSINNCGHFIPEERPTELLADLLKFVALTSTWACCPTG